MSVVAARFEYEAKKIEIVGDTQVTSENGMKERFFDKIVQVDENFVVGMAGDTEEATFMRVYAHSARPRSPILSDVYEWLTQFNALLTQNSGSRVQNSYILLLDGYGFVIHGLFITEMGEYAAIGSGASYALPALFLGASAIEAVECAIEFDAGCSAPVIGTSIPTNAERPTEESG